MDTKQSRDELLAENQRLRKELEDLRNSQILFQAVLDNAPLLISAKDTDGNIILTNSQFSALEGPEPEEFIGKNVYDLFPFEIADALWQNDLAAQSAQAPIKAEEQVAHKDGSLHTYYTYKFPLHNQQAQLLGTCAVSTDITQLKELQQKLAIEQELSRIKEYLDTIIFNLPAGVAIYEEEDFCFFRINQAFANLYGIQVEGSLGKPLSQVLPDLKDAMQAELSRVRETQQPIIQRESTILDPKNPKQERHLVDWLIPIKSRNDAPLAIVAVVLDVSDLHEAQTSLRRSQKMEALGTLAGGIAHDFNNILAVIMGNAEILLDELPPGDEAIICAQSIAKTTNRGAELVRQILTFSRMDATKLQPLNPVEVVDDALRLLRSTLPMSINIVKDFPESCPTIIANETQIHQVVLNLCTNAQHAFESPAGQGVISVSIYTEKNTVCLSVSDNGSGITDDDLEHIFDPFFTTKEVGKGTGLGLSVVHGIVEKHSGQVTATSEVGVGTTITVHLPASAAETETRTLPDTSIKTGSGHILVVEDEKELRALYQRLLERQGYTVTTCHSGEEAYDTFCNAPDQFNLVFTDQSMPKMTGKQLSQKILKIKPELPIILATGYSENITTADAQAMGIRKFLTKPIESKAISKMIEDCLGNTDSAQSD